MTPNDATADKPIPGPWLAPEPYGKKASLGQYFTIAAPVLAGFAVALVTVVATSREAFAAPDLILLLGVVASGAFIMAMQYGMHASQHDVSPDEYLAWQPMARTDRATLEWVRGRQHWDYAMWQGYSERARRMFHVGITGLLLSVVLSVLPADAPRLVPYVPLTGYLAAAVGLVWLAYELAWTLLPTRRRDADDEVGDTYPWARLFHPEVAWPTPEPLDPRLDHSKLQSPD